MLLKLDFAAVSESSGPVLNLFSSLNSGSVPDFDGLHLAFDKEKLIFLWARTGCRYSVSTECAELDGGVYSYSSPPALYSFWHTATNWLSSASQPALVNSCLYLSATAC